MRNKNLLLIFGILLFIFILTKVFTNQNERTFDTDIIQVDTLKVTSIVLHTKADNLQEVVLEKENEDWVIRKGEIKVPASLASVQGLFSNLATIRAAYIAAKSKDKWPEFELDEGKASRITIYNGKKVMADFFIGKYSVNQARQQITSYFRVSGNNEIFAVDGMAGMMPGKGFDAYRSKAALFLDLAVVESLDYSGDYPFSVKKHGNQWLLNGAEKMDTAKAHDFLLNLRQMSGDEFVGNFDPKKEQQKLLKTLTIAGSNMPEPVVVRCWQDTTRAKPFIIQSSQYPYSFFASDTARLFTRIFKPVKDW